MVYITGDTHGEQNRILHIERESGIKEGDYLIVCGDFGYVFTNNLTERHFLDDLEARPYTICFCDGNHENFPAIYEYPTETWNGGRIHRIRKNVIHLMRGQVFEIEGKKFFTMGGAYSIDKYMRFENVSWWKEELPNNSEYREAASSLKENGNAVDYIITHTAPTEIIRHMGYSPDAHDAELCGFLEWVMHEVKFEKWFFGHWHTEKTVLDKFRAIYFDIERVGRNENNIS